MTAVDLDSFLDLYCELSGRTILRPGALSCGKMYFTSNQPLTLEEAAWALETVMRLSGLEVQQFGPRLVSIAPIRFSPLLGFPRYEPKMSEGLADVPARTFNIKLPTPQRGGPPPPAGQGVSPQPAEPIIEPPVQLLEAYAKLINRRAVYSLVNPEKYNLSLMNPKPLTKAEAIFAAETTAMMNVLKFELSDDDKVTIQLRDNRQPR